MIDKIEKIELKEIEHTASLAKLDISREDGQFSCDIIAMLDMMGKISEIELPDDYKNFSALNMLDLLDLELTNTFREDTPKPSMPRKLALANAPEVEAGCISVPKIFGDREGGINRE